MRAFLPVYCRMLGYIILLLSIFMPFILLIYGVIDDSNLLLVKEGVKLTMIIGLLMILLAYNKNENEEIEKIRVQAMRRAFILTIIFLFGGMLYRLYSRDVNLVDTSSFIVYMALNVLCLEYGVKKAAIDKIFKR